MSQTFKSLRHRNFALYCAGIAASLTGSWMQSVAIAWVAFSLTGSSTVLGMVAFATLVPTIAFSLPAGWMAARYDRRRILLVTQAIAALQALALVALTATGHVQVWHLLALSALLGGLIAFELAARFPLIAELVDRDELMNACSLDSFLFYTARAAGPALGGVLLGWFGATVCFSINVASYAIELVTLLAIAKPPSIARESGGDLKETLAFFLRPGNRAVMALMSLTSLFAVHLAWQRHHTWCAGSCVRSRCSACLTLAGTAPKRQRTNPTTGLRGAGNEHLAGVLLFFNEPVAFSGTFAGHRFRAYRRAHGGSRNDASFRQRRAEGNDGKFVLDDQPGTAVMRRAAAWLACRDLRCTAHVDRRCEHLPSRRVVLPAENEGCCLTSLTTIANHNRERR
jgi:MFS family permease